MDMLQQIAARNAAKHDQAIERLRALNLKIGDAVGVGPVPTPSVAIPMEFAGWDSRGDPLVRKYGGAGAVTCDPQGIRGRVSAQDLIAYAESWERAGMGDLRQVKELRAAASKR